MDNESTSNIDYNFGYTTGQYITVAASDDSNTSIYVQNIGNAESCATITNYDAIIKSKSDMLNLK